MGGAVNILVLIVLFCAILIFGLLSVFCEKADDRAFLVFLLVVLSAFFGYYVYHLTLIIGFMNF